MNIKRVEVFGDSLLKGIQLNPQNNRYRIDNHIDISMLNETYGLNIVNHSKFGITVDRGARLIDAYLAEEVSCAAMVMDFGGNDCDYHWAQIADDPQATHVPHTPLDTFITTYKGIIQRLKQRGILPIVTTLPPLEPQLFFDWFCKGLDKENVLRWLGSISAIYRHQERYSSAVMKLAHETDTPLIDLREPFLRQPHLARVLCEDGTHPNTEGQKLLTATFATFAAGRVAV